MEYFPGPRRRISRKEIEYISGTSFTGHGSFQWTMKKPLSVTDKMNNANVRVSNPNPIKKVQKTFAKIAMSALNSPPIPKGSGILCDCPFNILELLYPVRADHGKCYQHPEYKKCSMHFLLIGNIC